MEITRKLGYLAPVIALCLLCSSGLCLTNLLQNGSLDVDDNRDGIADGWAPDIQQGAEGSFSIDNSVKHSGKGAQRIDHTSDNAEWVRVSQQPIAARPDTTYWLEFWVKSRGHCTAILYEFRSGDRDYVSHHVFSAGTTDGWRRYAEPITTTPHASYFKLSLITDGRGTAWFDDIALFRIDELSAVKVPRMTAVPEIDGTLDEPLWSDGVRLGRFMTLGGNGAPAAAQTTATIVATKRALYIGFECHEPDIEAIVAAAAEDGRDVWSDDRVEIYLDTACERADYHHFGVSAAGGKWHEYAVTSQWYEDWYSFGTRTGPMPTPSWSAAATIAQGRWFAELELPYDQLGGRPQAGQIWCVQLCRTRLAGGDEANSTWSYIPGDKYARPERFGSLVFCADGPAGARIARRDVEAASYEPTIVPAPTQATWRTGTFRFDLGSRIRIANIDQRPEAELLAADLRRRFQMAVPIGTSGPPRGPGGIDLAAPPGGLPDNPEAYRLDITPTSIRLAARSPRGRMYGVQTLRQMIAADAEGPFCRCARIIDAPAMKWRGWHTASPYTAADIPTYKKMVDVLAALKFNTIVWEVNDRLQYETRPAVGREDAPTKAQLRDLVQYAKSRHFRVIPQLATFAHFGYVLHKPKYRHLAESQETTLGHRSLFNYCPSNPEVYDLVFDLMGEVADVFQPDHFHIGHDEASFDDIGVCERCKEKEPWELWAEDVTKLDNWISDRGMRTIMWGDQFLPSHNGDEPYFTARATDMVPKDILIYDWHYGPTHDFDATIGYFKEHGFEVVGCPWYEPVNVFRFASAAYRNGIVGFCGTTWSNVRSTIENKPHLPAAWIIGAENAWSTDSPSLDEIPYQPVPRFNDLYNLRRKTPGRFRLIDMSDRLNESVIDTEEHPGWMVEGPGYDLRNLPTGTIWLEGIPFRIAPGAQEGGEACIMLAGKQSADRRLPQAVYELPIGMKAPALYFLHTCSIPDNRDRSLYERDNPDRIGEYQVNYADGTTVTIPLRYQANIADWNSQRGPAGAIALWQGKTRNGALASLAAVKWHNPHPDRLIRSLDFKSDGAGVKLVLLALTAPG